MVGYVLKLVDFCFGLFVIFDLQQAVQMQNITKVLFLFGSNLGYK